MQKLSSCHRSEKRSGENSTISPPPGERYREGVFAIQLTKTEHLPIRPRLDNAEHRSYNTTCGNPNYPLSRRGREPAPYLIRVLEPTLAKAGGEGEYPPPNFTITSQMSQNVTPCHKFRVFPLRYRNVVGLRASPPREQFLSPRSARRSAFVGMTVRVGGYSLTPALSLKGEGV